MLTQDKDKERTIGVGLNETSTHKSCSERSPVVIWPREGNKLGTHFCVLRQNDTARTGQCAVAHQIYIDLSSSLATFIDGVNHQGLTPTTV